MHITELAELVGDTDVFLAEYRDQKPLLRTGALSRPEELLTLHEIDDLLTSEAIRPPYFRMAKGGDQIRDGVFTRLTRVQLSHMDDVVDPASVIEAFRGGATITWNSMNHFNPTLRQLTTTISRTFGCRSDVVSFLTPGGNVQGFAPHLDSTEVFVIQLHGQKKWKVWDTITPRPSAGYALDVRRLGTPRMEFTMNPGDILYLPWGTPHVAESAEKMSFHLSVTTKPRSLGELLGDIVSDLTSADPFFDIQPTLNGGQAAQVAAALGDAVARLQVALPSLDLEAAARAAIEKGAKQVGSRRISFFETLAASETELQDATVLERDPEESPLAMRPEADGKVLVTVGLRTYRMSDAATPALEAVQADARVRLGALGTMIGEDAARDLVTLLLRIGYLRIAA